MTEDGVDQRLLGELKPEIETSASLFDNSNSNTTSDSEVNCRPSASCIRGGAASSNNNAANLFQAVDQTYRQKGDQSAPDVVRDETVAAGECHQEAESELRGCKVEPPPSDLSCCEKGLLDKQATATAKSVFESDDKRSIAQLQSQRAASLRKEWRQRARRASSLSIKSPGLSPILDYSNRWSSWSSRRHEHYNCRLCHSCTPVSSHRWPGGTKSNRQQIVDVNMSASMRYVISIFVAELIGTFFIVLIGDGCIAAYVVTRQKVELFPVCLAFGAGAMIAALAAAKISGAHNNPAATVAFALQGKVRWRLVPIYLFAQYLGGFLAALLLYINYSEAIGALDGGQHSSVGSANSTGHIFATYPGNWVSLSGSLLDQVVGTAVLLFALSALSDQHNAALESRHQPLLTAFVIGFVCLAFTPNCGAIFNPARDLAPRLLTYLLGYSSPSVWSHVGGLYWFSAGLLGPHLGAILGVFAYKFLIGDAALELELANNYEVNQSRALEDSLSGVTSDVIAPVKQASGQQTKFTTGYSSRSPLSATSGGQVAETTYVTAKQQRG